MNPAHPGAHPSFGIYEAKTRLSELVERAFAGETIEITRHGRPVAHLVAPSKEGVDADGVAATLGQLRTLGAEIGFDLDPAELKRAIEEGRE